MQFPLFHPAFCAVIPGALSVAEVKQNVAHMSVKIPVELWSELKREKLLDAAATPELRSYRAMKIVDAQIHIWSQTVTPPSGLHRKVESSRPKRH
jgi:hypothetical protein